MGLFRRKYKQSKLEASAPQMSANQLVGPSPIMPVLNVYFELGSRYCTLRETKEQSLALDAALEEFLNQSELDAFRRFLGGQDDGTYGVGSGAHFRDWLTMNLEKRFRVLVLFRPYDNMWPVNENDADEVAETLFKLTDTLALDEEIAREYFEAQGAPNDAKAELLLGMGESMVRDIADMGLTPAACELGLMIAVKLLESKADEAGKLRGDPMADMRAVWCLALRSRLVT